MIIKTCRNYGSPSHPLPHASTLSRESSQPPRAAAELQALALRSSTTTTSVATQAGPSVLPAVDTSDMSRIIASHHLHLHFINYCENVIILQTGERAPNHWSLAMQKGTQSAQCFWDPYWSLANPWSAARRSNGNCSWTPVCLLATCISACSTPVDLLERIGLRTTATAHLFSSM